MYDIRFGSGDEEKALWKGLDSKLSWLEKAPVQRRFDLFRRCHYPHIFENVYSGVGDVVFRLWRDIREHVLMQWYIGLVLDVGGAITMQYHERLFVSAGRVPAHTFTQF